MIKIIVDRILNVKSELQEVAKGNLLKIDEIKDDTNDEIKEMQLALLDLSNGLKEKQEELSLFNDKLLAGSLSMTSVKIV